MPDIKISATEFAIFTDIVEHETTPQGRRMIDMWACGADANSLVLIATFALLWR